MQDIGKTLAVLLACTVLMTASGAAAQSTLVVSGTFLDILVDVDHCDTSSSLCGGSGSIGAAADGNDSIVAVYVHVKGAFGNPISGLLEADFSLNSVTNPGGVMPIFVSSAICAACFAEPEPGVYRLAARTAFGDWSAGTYVTLLEVTYPNGNVRQVPVPIDIPS